MYDLYGIPISQNPYPGGHKISHFGINFIAHCYYMLDLHARVVKKTLKHVQVYIDIMTP